MGRRQESGSRTEVVEVREIDSVELEKSVNEDDRELYHVSDSHVKEISLKNGMVFVDFDDESGFAVPVGKTCSIGYSLVEREVDVPDQGGRRRR